MTDHRSHRGRASTTVCRHAAAVAVAASAAVAPVLIATTIALTLIILPLAVTPVEAHSELVASSPAPGAVLPAPPTEVSIEFSGPVALTSTIQVQDANYRQMQASETVTIDPAAPRVMRVPLKPLPDGGYTVQWMAVNPMDGHKTNGSYGFEVRAGAGMSQSTAGPPPDDTPGAPESQGTVTGSSPGTATTVSPGTSAPEPETAVAATERVPVEDSPAGFWLAAVAVLLLAGGFLVFRRRGGGRS